MILWSADRPSGPMTYRARRQQAPHTPRIMACLTARPCARGIPAQRIASTRHARHLHPGKPEGKTSCHPREIHSLTTHFPKQSPARVLRGNPLGSKQREVASPNSYGYLRMPPSVLGAHNLRSLYAQSSYEQTSIKLANHVCSSTCGLSHNGWFMDGLPCTPALPAQAQGGFADTVGKPPAIFGTYS